MGLFDSVLGNVLNQALGGQSQPNAASGLSLGAGSGAVAALLPVVLSMLRGGNAPTGGLGNVLGSMLGGGSAAGLPSSAGLGGLGALLQGFQQAGLGDAVASWVGTGQNHAVSPSDISKVFGADGLSAIARHAGVAEDDAAGGLAALLPHVVDHLTPNGQLPDAGQLEEQVGNLLSQFGHRA